MMAAGADEEMLSGTGEMALAIRRCERTIRYYMAEGRRLGIKEPWTKYGTTSPPVVSRRAFVRWFEAVSRARAAGRCRT